MGQTSYPVQFGDSSLKRSSKMEEMQIVPAANVEAQYVEMMVPLYSHGCEKKIKKALAHFKGIYSIHVNFNQQKVTVWGICNKYDVLSTIRGKRKGARFWNAEDNAQVLQLEAAVLSHTTPSSPTSSSSLHCPKRYAPSMALKIIKGRSLSQNWRAWKRVFARSYSF